MCSVLEKPEIRPIEDCSKRVIRRFPFMPGFYVAPLFEGLLNPDGWPPQNNNAIEFEVGSYHDTGKLIGLIYTGCVEGGCNCNYCCEKDFD